MEEYSGKYLLYFLITVLPVFLLLLIKKDGEVTDVCDKSNRKLILISLDGFRWDYIHGRARTPTFESLKRKGVYAEKGMVNSFISNTLPNHFSMITGLHPESHGMLDNLMYDEDIDSVYIPVYYDRDVINDPRWYSDLEPIWVSNQLQRADGRSGVLMWVGGDSPMKGVHPHRFILHSFHMNEITEMDHLMSWLTDEKEPINLGVVYFPEPDALAHVHGPESDIVTRKIEDLDTALKYLFQKLDSAGLSPMTDVIVLGDHGFTSISNERVIVLDDILDKDWYTTCTPLPASSLFVNPKPGHHNDVFMNLKKAADESGLFTVYEAKNIPERFHLKNHKRIPPIFAMASLNYSFVTQKEQDFQDKGNHGYDNADPMMRPIFMAFGPSFKANVTLDNIRNVDVYPLMCHLLGIEPKPNNGSLEATSGILHEDTMCMSSKWADAISCSNNDIPDTDYSCFSRPNEVSFFLVASNAVAKPLTRNLSKRSKELVWNHMMLDAIVQIPVDALMSESATVTHKLAVMSNIDHCI